MRLHSVHLTNYRGHKDLAVPLDASFNVVIGLNGSGKTSLLKAICDVLTGFTQFLSGASWHAPLEDATYIKFEKIGNSYRFEPQYPVSVAAKAFAFGAECTWHVVKRSQVDHAVNEGMPPGIAWQQSQAQSVSSGQPPSANDNLPVLLFYRADRTWPQAHTSDFVAATQRVSRVDAYASWANASLDSGALQTWVISKCLERFQTSSESSIPFDEVIDDELALVNKALSIAVDGVKGLRYDLKQKILLIEWINNEGTFPSAFENLSDGQRAVVGLVADIARRMCILNPQFKDRVMEESAGVILIDELDMHLHPRWQRILVTGLKKAFPKLQFITASHSPQVLGELHPNEILLLKSTGISHPQVSYGLSTDQVLEEIMEADSRPAEVDEKITELFDALERNDVQSAKCILESLKEKAPNIPELVGAESLLRRKELLKK